MNIKLIVAITLFTLATMPIKPNGPQGPIKFVTATAPSDKEQPTVVNVSVSVTQPQKTPQGGH